VCDGNILSEAGLAVIDTMGTIGGKIHSPEEYILIDSLTKRARLTALLLFNIASGNLTWKGRL
jgi:glutamate carboxypeptidase